MENPNTESSKILIVDDERANISVLQNLLKDRYTIFFALNGEKALDVARRELPDLILLDIMMPEMDGYEVCAKLKDDPKTRDIPVIFVTAMSEAVDEIKGLEIGAVDYITKPISPPVVSARVKSHLTLKHNMEELHRAYKIIESQKERMEGELNIGRDIQMSMVPLTFPPFPDRKDVALHAALQPAREVGGDFYDFFFIDENRLCHCVGDVSGKGVPAALFMAVAKALVKAMATNETSTGNILTRVNDVLSRDNSEAMFVTIFIGILNAKTGELVYTNAGHNPPYLKRENGSIRQFDEIHGLPLGVMIDQGYGESKTVLAKEDMLLLYTDGITEAMDRAQNFFSDQRLSDLLSSCGDISTEDVVNHIVSEVERFQDGVDQGDDITILAVQYLGAGDN